VAGQSREGFALALDVGGTFTDVILADRNSGQFTVTKSSSVPSDPAAGFFGGVDKILALAKVGPTDVSLVLHGSTLATNAILEAKGARTGLVTTRGFRHVLEIGRADIPRHANLYGWVKPKRPVRPRHVFEVSERVLADGTMHVALAEAELAGIAKQIREEDLAAVAIVFLNSFANPAHEKRAEEILRGLLPGVEIAISSDVLPIFREYERTLATVINASVQPLTGGYVKRLSRGLEERKIVSPFFIMKSNGGVFPPAEAARQPVYLALSGPAAGARGAAHIGRIAGYNDLITIDMGGTSADVALIRDGEPVTATSGRVGEFPLALPIVDIHAIGAGGGSIATVGPEGALTVGPESAGADPGPAAYGKGGRRATVTDANLVLGRVPPHLLDGEIALHRAEAEAAILRDVAAPLGVSLEDAARGIVEIVDNNMVGALKVMSVERGLAPSDFTLCAFGGAGPVHGSRLMRLLGAPRLLIPRHPGILCAMGLLATDLKYDFAVTRLQRGGRYDLEAIEATLRDLERQAHAQLESDGVPTDRRQIIRAADLRYAHQGVEISVSIGEGRMTQAAAEDLVDRFHERHRQLYTFSDRKALVELVNLRVYANGLMDHVALPEIGQAPAGEKPPASGMRPAAPEGSAIAEVPVYRRERLLAGHVIIGPAIVDQLDCTTVVLAGQVATVDPVANLIIEETR
jgi:N-methylhydantoinase A